MDIANKVKIKVESLLSSSLTKHALDTETATWVASLDTVMADKLASVGLIPKRDAATLADFLKAYIASRTDSKPRTHLKYESTRKALVAYFGDDKLLRDITEGDAEEWRLHLAPGRSENTLRKHAAVAKLFFGAAVKKRMIASNPFAGLKASIMANEKRFHFVTVEEAEKVIDACPDAEWRLIVALCRYGGLRCPSEHLALRWNDVDWVRNRITVHSPKTEHHAGGESRLIPIFPELRQYLEEADQLAGPGAEWVISRYRNGNQNLRTQFHRIIR
jgi:integrase